MNSDLEKREPVKYTLSDMLVAILAASFLMYVCVSITGGLTRSASNRIACLNQMRQLVLAAQNYQSAHLRYPMAVGQYAEHGEGSEMLSGFVTMLPQLEQSTLHETISNPLELDGKKFSSYPSPLSQGYPVWETKVDIFRCPDSYDNRSIYAQTNYAFCIGDRARNIHSPATIARGAFNFGLNTKISDVRDGMSNTIAFAEIATSSERRLNSNFAISQAKSILENPSKIVDLADKSNPGFYFRNVKLNDYGRGAHWAYGGAGFGMVNTILPPNHPSVAVDGKLGVDGIYTAGSFHAGGCIIALADGSARFVSDNIDAGDSSASVLSVEQMEQGIESPFGVWGALGTINAGEIFDDDSWE